MISQENKLVNIAFISKCILCEHFMKLTTYITSTLLLIQELFALFVLLKSAV